MFDNFNIEEPHLGLTKQAFTVLLKALEKLRKQALNGKVIRQYGNAGICYHWTHQLKHCRGLPYELVPHLAQRWKHTTTPGALTTSPVPHVHGHPKWKGPNLVMRLDLMTYMRKRLRDLHRRAPAV